VLAFAGMSMWKLVSSRRSAATLGRADCSARIGGQTGRIVQWVQIDQGLERLIDPFIEQDGAREGRTTMDDPVSDSIDRWPPVRTSASIGPRASGLRVARSFRLRTAVGVVQDSELQTARTTALTTRMFTHLPCQMAPLAAATDGTDPATRRSTKASAGRDGVRAAAVIMSRPPRKMPAGHCPRRCRFEACLRQGSAQSIGV